MKRSKKQNTLIKKIIKVVNKADEQIFDLTVKLMLSETPEVDKYIIKEKDIMFTVLTDDFLTCEEPMVKKLYHLINHLENVKTFIHNNYSHLLSEDLNNDELPF